MYHGTYHVVPPPPVPESRSSVPQLPPLHLGSAPEHVAHAFPEEPHALTLVPATHAPPLEQQPPLHGVSLLPPHALPQVALAVLHASSVEHCVCVVQPQAPLTHVVPFALPEQLAHVPLLPHVPGALPVTQRWLLQQVPPPHVPLPALPQVDVHDPAEQVGVPLAHTEQPPPVAPHAPLLVPAMHCPPLQHPPLHAVSVAPPHAVPHWCVEVSHACSAGQSVAFWQPQGVHTVV